MSTQITEQVALVTGASRGIGPAGNAGQSAYAAAKAGIIGFTKSVARELAACGITVNAVAPRFVETETVADLPEERRTGYLAVVPAGRLGTVDEVANVVGFRAARKRAISPGRSLQ
jgi:NAD(P)-dependent dehydrogenase (short-subunit alcohol dehydrogenase family)